jgi:hypothetical protein
MIGGFDFLHSWHIQFLFLELKYNKSFFNLLLSIKNLLLHVSQIICEWFGLHKFLFILMLDLFCFLTNKELISWAIKEGISGSSSNGTKGFIHS